MLDTKTMLKFADSLNRKDKGINVQVIMLKVSFYWLNVYFGILFFTRKISFLMNVKLFP